jgi:hypothetical protein
MRSYFDGSSFFDNECSFLLVPLEGSVGPPIFLHEGMEAVLGRNTFFSFSSLAGKVSRVCVVVRCVTGKLYVGRVQKVTNPIRVEYSLNQALLPEKGFVLLPPFSRVEFYPKSGCGFQVKQQSSQTMTLRSSQWRNKNRLNKLRSTSASSSSSSVCTVCNQVVCKCDAEL